MVKIHRCEKCGQIIVGKMLELSKDAFISKDELVYCISKVLIKNQFDDKRRFKVQGSRIQVHEPVKEVQGSGSFTPI